MATPPSALEGTTLHELLSEDENRLLDAIDELRSQGVGKLLGDDGLPQLIVCGDQSSGKSSVLEALTRVRFPTKSSVCTTFPTELRLRREPRSRISCRIKAAPNRSQDERERLASFHASFDSPEKFADLITAARNCMGRTSNGGDATGFFEDVLEVEIVGPKLAPLTIVDLPGLIHYSSTTSGDRDVKLVSDLVKSYMKQTNSIILAVVSAHNDINNQIVLRYIKEVVPDGHRTLGIVTKPDELPSGSEKELEYLDHARSNPSKFQYGWHVVRNRNYEEQASTFEERDEKEKDFFKNSNWTTLPRRDVGLGIDDLRKKLSTMLLDHITLSLPSMLQRLEHDLEQSESDLNKLGDPRTSPKDQANYLSDISDKFVEYTKEALGGRYRRTSFFGDPYEPTHWETRLRANVRNLNDEFATTMLKQGHKWHVVEDSEVKSDGFGGPHIEHPNIIAKSDFIKRHVDSLAQNERASELPGISNPLLIGSLFHQQCEPWKHIASNHLVKVWKAVKHFLEILLEHVTDTRTCNQLLNHVIEPAMQSRRDALKAKLEELMTPHQDFDPIEIGPHFAQEIWSIRQERVARPIAEMLWRDINDSHGKITITSVDDIVDRIHTSDTPMDDKYGSNETFEFMQAYYDTAILTFINNVASLAVEQCLLAGLPKIFSSNTIREMSEDILQSIAAESRESVLERERLTERVKVLSRGHRTLKSLTPRTRMNRQMAKESPIASTESGRPAASQGHTSSTSNTHKTLPTLSRYASSGSNAGSANRTPSKPHASATGPFSFLQQTTSEAFPTSARSDSLFASSQAPNTGDFVSSNIAGGNTLRVSGEQPSTSSLFGTSIQSPFGASSSSPASVLGSFTPGTFVLPANSASPQNFGSSNDYRPAKIAKGVPPSHGGK